MLVGQRQSAWRLKDIYDVDSEESNHLRQQIKTQEKPRYLMKKSVTRRLSLKSTSGNREKSNKSCINFTGAIRISATSTTALSRRCSNVPELIAESNSWPWNLNVQLVASMLGTSLTELRRDIFLLNLEKLCLPMASTGTTRGMA